MKPKNATYDWIKGIQDRARSRGWDAPKWTLFVVRMLDEGFTVSVYEAITTRSKYVTVTKGQKSYKVRFSNHKPNKGQELGGDSDFYVGVTHTGVRTTDDAIKATLEHFGSDQ